MIQSVHHIGCLVSDMNEAVADYLALYPQGEVSELFDITDQKVFVKFIKIAGLHIELVQPASEDSSLFRQLKKKPGFYHIGIFTDDIDSEIDRLEKEGYRKLNKFSSPAFNGRHCAFLYNLEEHLIELIENG